MSTRSRRKETTMKTEERSPSVGKVTKGEGNDNDCRKGGMMKTCVYER